MFTDGLEIITIPALEKAFKKLAVNEELQLKYIKTISTKKFCVSKGTLLGVSEENFFRDNCTMFGISVVQGSSIDEYFLHYRSKAKHSNEIESLVRKYFPH
jgi:hypothetical protein